MTARPQQPEPFVRGWAFPPTGTAAYPRLHPQEADQVPGDVWSSATLPVGVRIEVVGDASAVRLRYRTTTADLGYRGDGAGCSFVAFRSGRRIAEVPAVLGDGEVVVPLVGDPDAAAVIYLPEGMRPVVHQIQPVDGALRPAPRQPRCLVYGDAVTQGWLASSPVGSWSAVAGRTLGLDVCNLGFSGTTRLEPAVAQMIARTPAEAVVVAVGTGCWSRPPHSTPMLVEELRAFVQLVRAGHPEVPLVVMSPTCRPAAEDTPNVLGATLSDLRRSVEDVVTALAVADERLALLDGGSVLGPDELADGTYPGDEGHKRIAAAVRKLLVPYADELRQAAVARWQEEVLAASPAFAGTTSAARPLAAAPARRPRNPAAPSTTAPAAGGAMVPAGAAGAGAPAGAAGAGGAAHAAPGAGGAVDPAGAGGSAALAMAMAGAGVPMAPAGAGGPGAPAGVPAAITAAARATAAAARAFAAATARDVDVGAGTP